MLFAYGSESRGNHTNLALIGMGEDPSCGQMAKVKVTEWYGFKIVYEPLPKSKQMLVDEAGFQTGMYEV